MRTYPQRFKHGQWKCECQRCGFDYHSSEIRLEWSGLRVCKDCWEPRQRQDFIKAKPDRQAPPWTAPQSPEVFGAGSEDDL